MSIAELHDQTQLTAGTLILPAPPLGPLSPPNGLVERVCEGHVPSIARAISRLEAEDATMLGLLPQLYAAGGKGHVVGVTGAPGSGKSTLVGSLTRELRERGQRVGVVAVDPASAFSGGAILGDRIRMQEHALDPGVFIRSMSNRGALGGLSRATVDAIAVLDAAEYATIIVETVGAGQDEIDIVRTAHTTLVVSVPGMGDDIQAIKAGLLEIADLHVVNKADRPETNKAVLELRAMLRLSGRPRTGVWKIPVLETIASQGKGMSELADAIASHRLWLQQSGELEHREREAAAARVTLLAKEILMQGLVRLDGEAGFERVLEEVLRRRIDPRTAAHTLLRDFAG